MKSLKKIFRKLWASFQIKLPTKTKSAYLTGNSFLELFLTVPISACKLIFVSDVEMDFRDDVTFKGCRSLFKLTLLLLILCDADKKMQTSVMWRKKDAKLRTNKIF